MGKHRRPGPPNQPSRAVPRVDANDPLASYNERRRAPMDVYRAPGRWGVERATFGRTSRVSWRSGMASPTHAPDLAAAKQWISELTGGGGA